MSDVLNEIARDFRMSETEQKVRYGIGAAAAAAAIYAPLSYKWKGLLTGVAAELILAAVYGFSPIKRFIYS
jgi:hypothetical protein